MKDITFLIAQREEKRILELKMLIPHFERKRDEHPSDSAEYPHLDLYVTQLKLEYLERTGRNYEK